MGIPWQYNGWDLVTSLPATWGSIPGWRSRIPQATRYGHQKKKKETYTAPCMVVNPHDLVWRNGFFGHDKKHKQQKKKNKLGVIKLKTFVLQRALLRKWKDNPQNGRK